MNAVRLQSQPHSQHPVNVDAVLTRFGQYLKCDSKRLSEITMSDLLAYVGRRKKDRWHGRLITNTTINNDIRILNAALRRSGPKGRGRDRYNFCHTESPPSIAELPDTNDRDPVVVHDDQIGSFMQAAASAQTPSPAVCDPGLFWRAVLLLELATSLRRRALLFIPRPSDEELFEDKIIILPGEFNKTGRRLTFPLGGSEHGDEIVRTLADLPSRPGEPLLPWRHESGKRMSLNHFTCVVKKIQRAAGIPENARLRLKDLRSTAGTLISDEYGDAVAKKKLGHSPNTNTIQKHYKSYKPREKDREASDFMAAKAIQFIRPMVDEPDPDDRPTTIRFPGVVA